ncbi:hypothetical protein CVT24_006022 [Panaeolus cyanescens]|uniref:Fucose-specific lectin n=1 Tax=Panaeolus cyanescens TaxID=181874 RepID=A0A409YE35_9AGAR|nr:hypothetical protein CVT24_006022 [Panaeolus cyanescens]
MFASNVLRAALFFFIACQFLAVSAKPEYSLASKRSRSSLSKLLEVEFDTNAKRMSAGLSPRTPTRPFNPTRIVGRQSQPSPTLYSGKVVARDTNGADIGWISKTTSTGRIRMTTGIGDVLPVSLTYYSSGAVLGLSIDDNLNWKWVGVQGSALSGPSSTTVNGFVRSNPVAAGSPAAVVGHSAGSGSTETHIFKFNPTTNEITAVWVNPDSAVLDAYFYLSNGPGLRFFYLTSNPNLTSSSGVTRVSLYLA